MIIRDLRPCVRHFGKKSGFADIRKAYQSYIGNYFQFQQKFQLLRRLPRLGISGRLHGAGGVMLVAVTAFPAAQKQKSAVIAGHIRDDLTTLSLLDDRSGRYLDRNIFPVLTRTVTLVAVFPVSGAVFANMPEVRKRVQALVHLKVDAAALTAVTAVRTAIWHIFFSAERHVSVSAFTAFYINFCTICKHNFLQPVQFKTSSKDMIEKGSKHLNV